MPDYAEALEKHKRKKNTTCVVLHVLSFPCLQQKGVLFFKTFPSVLNVCAEAEIKLNYNNAAAWGDYSNALKTERQSYHIWHP